MSSSSRDVSEPTISSAVDGTRTAILPMARIARREISTSTSVTYSLSSATIGSALPMSASHVRISIFTVLMYDGSLYRQKNCLKSEPKTSIFSPPRETSAWMWTSTVYASSGVGAAMSVSKGPLRRLSTSICKSMRLLVRSTKILVTARTTALLDCLRRPSRMFMMSNISPSSPTEYLVSNLKTAHWPHSENWLRRLSMFVTISRVGWIPPSSARTSSTAQMVFATTCASLSWMSLLSVGNRSLSSTAAFEMWNTFNTPMTAVFRT
mmetsp:Transcript_101653/g.270360  ORF Transcript_101653/g.270360 Transcript_101653/m.270360 type:complete len:266 (-) Transcript_101653:628-1425(-)